MVAISVVAQEHLALGRIDQPGDCSAPPSTCPSPTRHDAQRLAAADVEIDVDRGLHDPRLLKKALPL